MTAFAFRFTAGRYHATPWGRHANEADIAWPPEPVRILRALIATWWRKADRAAFPKAVLDDLIDALATKEPAYHLPDAVHAHLRAYMPLRNATEKTLIYDGFLRFDGDAELIVHWTGLTLPAPQRAMAAHLLGRIGYLGRAESWVEARLIDDPDGAFKAEFNALPRSETGSEDAVATVPVDVTLPLTPESWQSRRAALAKKAGSLPKGKRADLNLTLPERLSDALAVDTGDWYRAGWSSPPPLRRLVYDRPAIGPLPPVRRAKGRIGPRSDLVQPDRAEVARFLLAGRPRPRVEDTLRIAEIARCALTSRGDRAKTPDEFLGKGELGPLRDDPAHRHAFFLPEDADGDGWIDHLIIYCRRGFSLEARRRLDGLRRLWLPGTRERQTDTEDGTDADDAGDPGRREWRVALEDIGPPGVFSDSPLLGRGRVWVPATPCLKSRHDRVLPRAFEEVTASYRDQILLEWQRRFPDASCPAVAAQADRGGRFFIEVGRERGRRSTLAFARTRGRRGGRQPDAAGGAFTLTFDRLVDGPIALGWGCHFGLGLFRRES